MTNTAYTHRVPRRRTKVTGMLGPGLLTPRPARIIGAVQNGGECIPPACHHCRAEPPMWVTDAHSGSCRACGATFFKTAHQYQLPPPRRYNTHPIPVWMHKKGA